MRANLENLDKKIETKPSAIGSTVRGDSAHLISQITGVKGNIDMVRDNLMRELSGVKESMSRETNTMTREIHNVKDRLTQEIYKVIENMGERFCQAVKDRHRDFERFQKKMLFLVSNHLTIHFAFTFLT